MNIRRLLTALCFALLCSGLLTWQLSRRLTHAAPSAAAPAPVRNVVVATKDMAAGESLLIASLTTVSLPASEPLQGLFSRPQDLAGRVLLVPVSSGEPINAHDLASSEATTGLAATIPDGMRAVSLLATDESAKSFDLMTPGSHVDILVSYRSEKDATFISSMVLQDVRVLGSQPKKTLDANTKLSPGGAVELLVTPEEAARLTVANSLGKLTFALRNGTDRAVSPGLSYVTLSSVQNRGQRTSSYSAVAQHKPPSQKILNSTFAVETLSGGKSSVQTFQEGQQ